MCRRITCSSCGKPSFAGCGRHVESVLADVPREARCQCHESELKASRQTEALGFLSALFGPRPRKGGAP